MAGALAVAVSGHRDVLGGVVTQYRAALAAAAAGRGPGAAAGPAEETARAVALDAMRASQDRVDSALAFLDTALRAIEDSALSPIDRSRARYLRAAADHYARTGNVNVAARQHVTLRRWPDEPGWPAPDPVKVKLGSWLGDLRYRGRSPKWARPVLDALEMRWKGDGRDGAEARSVARAADLAAAPMLLWAAVLGEYQAAVSAARRQHGLGTPAADAAERARDQARESLYADLTAIQASFTDRALANNLRAAERHYARTGDVNAAEPDTVDLRPDPQPGAVADEAAGPPGAAGEVPDEFAALAAVLDEILAGQGAGLAWRPGGGGVPGAAGEVPDEFAALAPVLDGVLAKISATPGGQVPMPARARDGVFPGREDSVGPAEPAPAALGLVPNPPDDGQQAKVAGAGLEWVRVSADGDCLMSALLAAAPPGTFGADASAGQLRVRMADFLEHQIAVGGPFWLDWEEHVRLLLAEDRANRVAARLGRPGAVRLLTRYYHSRPLTSADHSELVAAMRQPGEWGHAAADLAPAVAAATFGLDLTIIQPRGFSNRFHAPGRPAVTIIRVPGHWHAARDAASRPGTTTRRASAPAVPPAGTAAVAGGAPAVATGGAVIGGPAAGSAAGGGGAGPAGAERLPEMAGALAVAVSGHRDVLGGVVTQYRAALAAAAAGRGPGAAAGPAEETARAVALDAMRASQDRVDSALAFLDTALRAIEDSRFLGPFDRSRARYLRAAADHYARTGNVNALGTEQVTLRRWPDEPGWPAPDPVKVNLGSWLKFQRSHSMEGWARPVLDALEMRWKGDGRDGAGARSEARALDLAAAPVLLWTAVLGEYQAAVSAARRQHGPGTPAADAAEKARDQARKALYGELTRFQAIAPRYTTLVRYLRAAERHYADTGDVNAAEAVEVTLDPDPRATGRGPVRLGAWLADVRRRGVDPPWGRQVLGALGFDSGTGDQPGSVAEEPTGARGSLGRRRPWWRARRRSPGCTAAAGPGPPPRPRRPGRPGR